MSEWQPIETAPKDETALLLFVGADRWDLDGVIVGFWSVEGANWFDAEWASNPIWATPTHWMPLPQPPVDLPPQEERLSDGAAMNPRNPANYECGKGDGSLHRWERLGNLGARCLNCRLELSPDDAAEVFAAAPAAPQPTEMVERALEAWFDEYRADEAMVIGGFMGMSNDKLRADMRAVIAIPLNEVLNVIADEQRRATEPAAVGALANVRNAIGAMMEEPTP